MFLVFNANYNNVMALFVSEAHADAYILANGGSKVPADIPVPFFAVPSIPVFPA